MSIVLYRPGKGTIENGVECESITVEPEHMSALLDDGWAVTPPGADERKPVDVDSPEGAVTFDTQKDPGHVADEFEQSAVTGYDEEQVKGLKAQAYEDGVAAGKAAVVGEMNNLRAEVERLTTSEANLRAQLAAYGNPHSEAADQQSLQVPDRGEGTAIDSSATDHDGSDHQSDDVDGAGQEGDIDYETADPDDIRRAAQEAGIDGWDSKRVKTLRAELKAQKGE